MSSSTSRDELASLAARSRAESRCLDWQRVRTSMRKSIGVSRPRRARRTRSPCVARRLRGRAIWLVNDAPKYLAARGPL